MTISKSPAKKSPAKKPPAKKSPAKKSPAKKAAPQAVPVVEITSSAVTQQPKEKIAEQVTIDQAKENFQGEVVVVPAKETPNEKAQAKYKLKVIKEQQRQLREEAKMLRERAKAERNTGTSDRQLRLAAQAKMKDSKAAIRLAMGNLKTAMRAGDYAAITEIRDTIDQETKNIVSVLTDYASNIDPLDDL